MLPQIILNGCQIIRSKVVTKDIMMESTDYFFLTGVVYSPQGETIAGAAIMIYLIDHNTVPPVKKRLGITFTATDGSYGISIPRQSGQEYKVVVYLLGT